MGFGHRPPDSITTIIPDPGTLRPPGGYRKVNLRRPSNSRMGDPSSHSVRYLTPFLKTRHSICANFLPSTTVIRTCGESSSSDVVSSQPVLVTVPTTVRYSPRGRGKPQAAFAFTITFYLRPRRPGSESRLLVRNACPIREIYPPCSCPFVVLTAG